MEIYAYLYVYMYIYMYLSLYIYTYTHIFTHRDRERGKMNFLFGNNKQIVKQSLMQSQNSPDFDHLGPGFKNGKNLKEFPPLGQSSVHCSRPFLPDSSLQGQALCCSSGWRGTVGALPPQWLPLLQLISNHQSLSLLMLQYENQMVLENSCHKSDYFSACFFSTMPISTLLASWNQPLGRQFVFCICTKSHLQESN